MLSICSFAGISLDLTPCRFRGERYLALCNRIAFLRSKTPTSLTAVVLFHVRHVGRPIKAPYGTLSPDGVEFWRAEGTTLTHSGASKQAEAMGKLTGPPSLWPLSFDITAPISPRYTYYRESIFLIDG